MRLFTPTESRRLNEVTGVVLLAAGILLLLSLASFQPQDRSWDTAAGEARALNLIGTFGAHIADVLLQGFGLAAFLFPLLIFSLGYKWVRSEALSTPLLKLVGSMVMIASACGAAALLPDLRIFSHSILLGGVTGYLIADTLRHSLNSVGAAVVLATALIISTYLVSTFTLAKLDVWLAPLIRMWRRMIDGFHRFLEQRRERALQRAEMKRQAREARLAEKQARIEVQTGESHGAKGIGDIFGGSRPDPAITRRTSRSRKQDDPPIVETLPWEDPPASAAADTEAVEEIVSDEIPICTLAETPDPDNVLDFPFSKPMKKEAPRHPAFYTLPDTAFLNEIPARSAFDEQELKNTASAIKAKFEEFNVFGSVVQINPGPVVTTFEFKPEAGIKYSKITNLTRRPVPRPASRIDPDRTHSRQAHDRHRGAEHEARSHQPARGIRSRTSSAVPPRS